MNTLNLSEGISHSCERSLWNKHLPPETRSKCYYIEPTYHIYRGYNNECSVVEELKSRFKYYMDTGDNSKIPADLQRAISITVSRA